MSFIPLIFFLLLILASAIAQPFSFSFTLNSLKQDPKRKVKEVPLLTTGKPEGCLFCHEEKVQEKAHAKEMLGCSSCHLGNPLTVDHRAAHKGVVKNPSDLRVVARTCGQANCHPQDLKRVKNSLMATNHGIIMRLLRVFGEEAILKQHPDISVEDLYKLKTSSLALDYFKKLCGSCHLFLERGKLPGFLSEKGGGCSACHLVGKREDLKKHKVHPRLTAKIPLDRCVLCHNRSGRIGLTYQGWYEDEQSGEGEGIFIDGRKLRKISPDVHYKAGLHCIDCHTKDEVMGNGTFYRGIEEALQVDCETCHVRKGLTKVGTRLEKVEVKDGKTYLKGKLQERRYLIKTPAKDCQDRFHRRLSCSACHARYVPQCYGCHVRYDPREKHLDKILVRETKGLWEEHESYRRVEDPILAVKGDRIVVVTPGCQDFVSILSEEGKLARYFESLTFAQVEPHSTQRKGRSCRDCHQNPKVVGLGYGWGLDRLSQVGGPEGNPLAKFNRKGLRPFTKEELGRILKVGVCLTCHREGDQVFKNWRSDLKCPRLKTLP